MLGPGVYPAAVTPFGPDGSMDAVSLARLLAAFEAAGCAGVVLGGTTGEGPSLSAVERRDIVRWGVRLAGGLRVIAGVATASLPEAGWLCAQAAKSGATAALAMPPALFRDVPETGLREWFLRLADASPLPILVYNCPRPAGVALSADFLASLAGHERIAGVKDSSGSWENLESFRQALPAPRALFVGDESLLVPALEAGWDGCVSGAANVLPVWIAEVMGRWSGGDREGARVKAAVLEPVVTALRAAPQPATYKALLHAMGLVAWPEPRPPLEIAEPDALLALLEARIGTARGRLGLPARQAGSPASSRSRVTRWR